jgi:hypothetical protein
MDFEKAIKTTQDEPKVREPNSINIKDLPKGWVVLHKDGSVEDTMTPEEREQYERHYENHRKKMVLDNLKKNMIRYKREDMEKEGYQPEEVDVIIERMLEEQEDESSLNYDTDSCGESGDFESDY